MDEKEIYESLSYAMQKKTDKIVELKSVLDDWKGRFLTVGTMTGLSAGYVLAFMQRYVDNAAATFNVSASANAVTPSQKLDLLVFLIMVFSGAFLYYVYNKHSAAKKKYDDLRRNIVESINNEFLSESRPQACKDEYLKWMEGRGIDLIL